MEKKYQLTNKYLKIKTPDFKSGWKNIVLPPTPKNTIEELEKVRKEIFKTTEQNLIDMGIQDTEKFEVQFLDIIPDKSESMHKKIINLAYQLAAVCAYFKRKYNRARPMEYAKEIGFDFPQIETMTAKSESYPSGHAFAAHFLASLFSKKYPRLKKQLHDFAEDCAMNRIRAGLHFFSDMDAGITLSKKLMTYYDPKESSSLSFSEWFSL
jgi:hypothetical protein